MEDFGVRDAYNRWSTQYDTNENKTRDLEAHALRDMLQHITFHRVLELGCGTGKNTVWLAQHATEAVSVDFSEEMLSHARAKLPGDIVRFVQADLRAPWHFAPPASFDLATFSLVLEHIEHLAPVMEKLHHTIQPGGYVYIGELHPFKQYQGSKARFETAAGVEVLACYQHHMSDFIQAARLHQFDLIDAREYFDNDDRSIPPRILALLFRRRDG